MLNPPPLTIQQGRQLLQGKKPAKYRAQPVVLDGIRFASRKEAGRYQNLTLMEKTGLISNLMLQPEYTLYASNGFKVEKYRADFRYVEDGIVIVEDCKGFKTTDYKRKRKWMKGVYGIVIRET